MPTQFSVTRSSEWSTGFVAQVTMRPEATLNGWTLRFDAGFSIVNIWGAEIVSFLDGVYTIRNASWNATGWNGEIGFGFQAATTGPEPDPSRFTLAAPGAVALPPPPVVVLPTVSVGDVLAWEHDGAARFVLTLSKASATPVTVTFATANDTALARSDYRAATGSITFAAGETSKVVSVGLVDNATREQAERFLLNLTGATGATIADGQGIATIEDDDIARFSVADASVTEGNAGTRVMTFAVSLSKAQDVVVSTRFQTADGPALAGSDYVARSGTLSFQPGELSKTIRITINGDTQVEADESFLLRLTNPVRAAYSDAEATGTIINNDLPRITVADAAAVVEGDPFAGLAPPEGVLSTRGGSIVDAQGNAVQLAAVNWFGLETSTFSPHGLGTRNWRDMMDQILETGFNAIRLPFSAQAVQEGGTPNGINWNLNPDLVGLTPLQIMDRIVDYAGEIGLRIILDHHRSAAGNGANGNGLWYDGRFTEARCIDMWEDLAVRYRGSAVVGADLHNEPHNVAWNAWAGAAERAGNAVLAANPDWLVLVEGVGDHNGSYYWWGGNLMGAAERPVQLNVANKLVYSPHDYPNSVYAQPFFQGPDFPANLPGLFDKMWGYLWREGTAPVLMGEFGSRLVDPKDQAWADKLIAYLSGDVDADGDKDIAGPAASFAWWSWNPNSGDTGGILADDWETVLTTKTDRLAPIMPGVAEAPAEAVFLVSLSQAAAAPVSVNWRTRPGTAAESDFVAATGVLTFAPGETVKRIAVALRPDEAGEGTETFELELSQARGATIGDGIGVATILDDDAGVAAARLAASDWAL
ncbi:cellulase family glycosylhydrolase [Falsiroseomonas stagni]|uniref:cellulase n=1 Tax=Falsiroseomonas stagni DSM 19981 TaxID=1123062 RepID=A0A1I3Z7W2_9PROT|nr:cellulase family glycosylhydrolase [Falsiroseomonas stagni]SFK40113.1 Aryl-phospho-beta-D-glucosidase BglC, GH1 family [Falsiroseomonas stagni DSM 19981]